MHVDLTVNLPLILTAVGAVWALSAAISGRFARLETLVEELRRSFHEQLEAFKERLTDHADSDERQLARIDSRIDRLGAK